MSLVLHYAAHIAAFLVGLGVVLLAIFRVSLITKEDVLRFVEGVWAFTVMLALGGLLYWVSKNEVRVSMQAFFQELLK